RWPDAAQLLARAVELETDPKEKADLYAKLGRLFRDRLKNVDLSRKCFEKSLELVPTDRHTLESTARLLETAGDFEKLEQIYARAAQAAHDEKTGDEAAFLLKRADVVWKKLRRPKQAVKDLEAILSLEPAHAGARAALAEVYQEIGDTAGVERIHRGFLREDPLVVDHYKALVEAWRTAGKRDAHAQGAQVLAVLQAASEDDRAAIKNVQAKESPARRGLKVDDWVRLASPDARGPVYDLLVGLADSFEKSVPEDLKSYGLGMLKRSLPLEGESFPEHRLVKRVADLLGIKDDGLDLYWMADWKRPEAILAHAKRVPALILCPATFAGLSEQEKAFVIARTIALVPARLEPARALAARELEKLVLSAAKALDPESALRFSGEDDKESRAFVARAVKQLTPELQEQLKPVIADIVRSRDKLNVEGFRRSAILSASRAGVLAASGAQAAASAVVKTNVALRGKLPPTTQEVVRELREVAEVKDILEFSVSQAYLALRRELGISKE
ncbi:hypothetical protein HY251_16595, partial [bacterium]|nr:hypothetical protein [bacterium]